MSIVGRILAQRKANATHRELMEGIIAQLSGHFVHAKTGKIFVVMVGLTQAGKTTLVVKHPQLQYFARVNSTTVHQELNRRLGHWHGLSGYCDRRLDQRQRLERRIRLELLGMAFQSGRAVVEDSCNLNRDWRRRIIALANSYGYRTFIIWMDCSDHILIDRLVMAARFQRTRR